MKTRLVLASTSAVKRKVLQDMGVSFEVIHSEFVETEPQKVKPEKYAKEMALGKAKSVREKMGKHDTIIIGVDTIAVLGAKIMGKPKSPFEAKKFLREMSGQKIFAMTGLAVIDALSGKEIVEVVKTEVRFREISLAEIDAYVLTGEPLDAAGAYKIQGKAGIFIEEIKGDYYNVIGVPVCRISQIIQKEFGFSLLESAGKKEKS